MKPVAESETPESPCFTQSYQALEQVVEQFRQGTPTLEESLSLFESGVTHLRICQEKLGQARGQVEELVKTLQTDAEAATRPFEMLD